MNLDRQLREALTRKNPPPDLVERVVATIESANADRRRPNRTAYLIARPEGRAYMVAAAILIVIAIGFGVVRQRATTLERERGQTAAQQLMTALQIASETLNDAQRIVKQTN